VPAAPASEFGSVVATLEVPQVAGCRVSVESGLAPFRGVEAQRFRQRAAAVGRACIALTISAVAPGDAGADWRGARALLADPELVEQHAEGCREAELGVAHARGDEVAVARDIEGNGRRLVGGGPVGPCPQCGCVG
jgi:hypothetical protein